MKNAGIYVLTVCAVALAMLGSSCKKETKPFEVGEIIEIGASIDNDDNGAKTFIYENGSSTDVYWSDDDKLTLFRMNGSESSEFSIVGGAGSKKATFRGECPGDGPFLAFYPNNNVTYASADKKFTYTLPSIIEYDAMSNHNGPMVGYLAEIAEDKVLQFHNVLPCIYLKLKGTAKVKKVSIWDKQDLVISGTLTFKVDGSGSITTSSIKVEKNSSNPNACKYVSVVSQNAIQLSETEPTIFSFSVPKGIGIRCISVFVYDENDEVVGSYSSGKISSSGTQYGKAYRIEIDGINPKQDLDVNSGHFSVGPSKQVDFAPGNLYYNNSDGTFHIETTQCLLPLKDIYDAPYDASHVNFFYFATKKNLADSYKERWAGYRNPSASDVFFTNKTATTSNPELQIDGQTNTGYRVLSGDEWDYLLNGRTDATALRAVKRIAVPDPAGFDSFIVGIVVLTDNSDPAWLPNIHSLADVDKVGALFLSSQGYYIDGDLGNYYDGIGRYLQYWGSNCKGYKSAYLLQAFWNNDNSIIGPKVAQSEYYYAQPVRLAKDVTAQ